MTQSTENTIHLDEQRFWLGFSLIPSIGQKRILHLRNWFEHLEHAWHASANDLRASGLDNRAIESLQQHRPKLDLNQEMDKIAQQGAWLLTLADEKYPTLLKELHEAPPVIYIRGTLFPEDQLSLAIVGTRKATKYGHDVAYDFSRQLADQHITIVSGLAQGIDTKAHQGALSTNGRTLAVLGCGVDIYYPRQNRELAESIIESGALISEFPIGAKPIAQNFPRRNRILSGLSLGVLVIEAPEGSGALITASLAGDQGRDVFAVPANIYNKMGRGTNKLIQDGAKLVYKISDVLDELNVSYQTTETRVRTHRIVPSNEFEASLLELLQADPIHIDELVRLSGLPIAQVSSTLTILELKGLAQMVGNMQYSLNYLR